MKYWNKQHRVRAQHWHRFEINTLEVRPRPISFISWTGSYQGWMTRGPYERLKRALQNNPSKGKFYTRISVKEIWFERAEDMTMFALTFDPKDYQ
jgi:hypothetical protein